jgi:hypothetical protein
VRGAGGVRGREGRGGRGGGRGGGEGLVGSSIHRSIAECSPLH